MGASKIPDKVLTEFSSGITQGKDMDAKELRAQVGEAREAYAEAVQAIDPASDSFAKQLEASESAEAHLDRVEKAFAAASRADTMRAAADQAKAEDAERIGKLVQASLEGASDEAKPGVEELIDTWHKNHVVKGFDAGEVPKTAARIGTIEGLRQKSTVSTSITGGSMSHTLERPDFVDVGYRQTRLRDLSGVVPLAGERAVEFVRVSSWTSSADVVAEAATKPESDIGFELKAETVQTIAHNIPATRQALRSRAQLQRLLERRLLLGLLVKEDDQILNGTGSGQLQGITTETGVLTQSIGADTKADAIHKAMVKIWDANAGEIVPNAVAMNINDWQDIVLAKTTADEDYIFPAEWRESFGGNVGIWGLRRVVTPAVPAGTAVVGAWGVANQLYEEEAAMIRISDSHGTTFVENILTLLAEESVVQTVDIPAGFCVVTLV